jgi:cobyric acid synthase
MNPVLLKPQADATSQVIVLGKAQSVADAAA